MKWYTSSLRDIIKRYLLITILQLTDGHSYNIKKQLEIFKCPISYHKIIMEFFYVIIWIEVCIFD